VSLQITAATEGYPDEVVVHSLCRFLGIEAGTIYNCGGKPNLDKKLHGYNQAAKGWYWLVLRDLDHDADCAPTLLNLLLPQPNKMMMLRIVVREIESWLLGDRERFSQFIGVDAAAIPSEPEILDDPKGKVIQLAKRSRKRNIRKDMAPRQGSGAKEGPAYASCLAEFADNHWRPDVASLSCDSLKRCLDRMRDWTEIA